MQVPLLQKMSYVQYTSVRIVFQTVVIYTFFNITLALSY